MVEAALVIPILLLVFFFVIDLARYTWVSVTLKRAAHVGADIFSKSLIEEDLAGCDQGTITIIEACQSFIRYFDRAAELSLNATRSTVSSSDSPGAVTLRPYQHYSSDGQIVGNQPVRDVIILRPGERAQRVSNGQPTGEFYVHPTRSFEDGWPGPGESWEEVLSNHPVVVRLEVDFRPITPFFPSLVVGATQFAYRRAGGFVDGAPPLDAAVCGDGIIQAGEACDPPAMGGCTGDCIDCVCCGDGVRDPREQCDGDDLGDCDACWPPGSGALSCTCRPVGQCGDGFWDPNSNEECDPSAPVGANGVGIDGCLGCRDDCSCIRCPDPDSLGFPGVQCLPGRPPGEFGGCPSGTCNNQCQCEFCGDGIIQPPEQCDGNALGECLACWPPGFADECTCRTAGVCGDGIWDPNDEECDASAPAGSNGVGVGGCTACRASSAHGFAACTCIRCGHPDFNPGPGECNTLNGNDDCGSGEVCENCRCRALEPCEGEPCGGPGWVPTPACPSCVPGTCNCSEACPTPTHSAPFTCRDTPTWEPAGCFWRCCGNNVKDPGEVCDGPEGCTGDRICRSDCQRCMRCGDGVVDPELGEQCDGSAGIGPNCPACYPPGDSLGRGCTCREVGICGDGFRDPPEECDPGGNRPGVGQGGCLGCRPVGDPEQCTCIRCGDSDYVPGTGRCNLDDSQCPAGQECSSNCVCVTPACPTNCQQQPNLAELCATPGGGWCDICAGCPECECAGGIT